MNKTAMAAMAMTLLMSTQAFSQTDTATPPDAPQPEASEDNPQADLQLREAPERHITGLKALERKPGGLTSHMVAQRAAKSSPMLRVRKAEIDEAQAKIDDAVAQFLPRLTLGATYTRVSPVDMGLEGALVGASQPSDVIIVDSCPDLPGLEADQCPLIVSDSLSPRERLLGAGSLEFPFLVDHYALNAKLSLPISDYILRLSQTMTAANANREAAELQEQAESLKIESDARVAYYNWLRTVAGGSVAQSSLVRYQALLKDTRDAFETGVSTKADVLRIEAAVAGTELAIAETESLRRLSEEQLATLMDEEVQEYEVGENIAVDPATISEPAALSTLLDKAYQNRLELKSLKATTHALDASASAIRVGRWPRLDAFGDVTYANPNPQIFPQEEEWNATWALGVSLSWTVNDFFSSNAQASGLEATQAKIMANRENLERGIKLEVTSAYYEAKKARIAVEKSARASLAAQEAYRVASDLYQVGRATTTDLIEAETELVNASLKEVNAALDYHISKVKLAYAIGKKLDK